jgi:hypothetical protein
MLEGTFRLQENSFLVGNRKFVIKERKEPTTKPKLYLIGLSPFQYISSLFPVDNTISESYTFDYQKKLYMLRKQAGQVEVTELP